MTNLPDVIADLKTISADKIAHSLLLFRLGNDERPASQEDIDNTTHELMRLFPGEDIHFLITHHCIDVKALEFPPNALCLVRVGNQERPADDADIAEAKWEAEAALSRLGRTDIAVEAVPHTVVYAVSSQVRMRARDVCRAWTRGEPVGELIADLKLLLEGAEPAPPW